MKKIINWLYHRYNKEILSIPQDRVITIKTSKLFKEIDKRNMKKLDYSYMVDKMLDEMDIDILRQIKEFIVLSKREEETTMNSIYTKKINVIMPI